MPFFDDGDTVLSLLGILIGVFLLIGVPVMAVIAFRRTGDHLARLAWLQQRVASLEQQIEALRRTGVSQEQPRPVPPISAASIPPVQEPATGVGFKPIAASPEMTVPPPAAPSVERPDLAASEVVDTAEPQASK